MMVIRGPELNVCPRSEPLTLGSWPVRMHLHQGLDSFPAICTCLKNTVTQTDALQ